MKEMRHYTFNLLALCSIALLLSACKATWSADAEPVRQSLTVAHTKCPIVVDGKADDWPKDAVRAKIALDSESEEFSGTSRLTWDEKYLYVIFEVATGKGMLNAGGDASVAYKTGDTVELFLSVNPAPLADRVPRGPNLDTAKEGDYRILMTLLKNTQPVVFGYDFVNAKQHSHPMVLKIAGPAASMDVVGLVPGADLVVKNSNIGDLAGYTAEARIPWAYFRGYHPKSDDRLLFNLAINFSNASGTSNMGKSYWNGPGNMVTDVGIEAQIYPENWGWLVLK